MKKIKNSKNRRMVYLWHRVFFIINTAINTPIGEFWSFVAEFNFFVLLFVSQLRLGPFRLLDRATSGGRGQNIIY